MLTTEKQENSKKEKHIQGHGCGVQKHGINFRVFDVLFSVPSSVLLLF